jgi:hypothetical protein
MATRYAPFHREKRPIVGSTESAATTRSHDVTHDTTRRPVDRGATALPRYAWLS